MNEKNRRKVKNCSDSKQELSLLNSFHEKYSILLSKVFLENSFCLIIQQCMLIVNVISAIPELETLSGNITALVADRFEQFLLIKKMLHKLQILQLFCV